MIKIPNIYERDLIDINNKNFCMEQKSLSSTNKCNFY